MLQLRPFYGCNIYFHDHESSILKGPWPAMAVVPDKKNSFKVRASKHMMLCVVYNIWCLKNIDHF